MAYPYDRDRSYLRDPISYPHDAFGVDTGGRTMPHTGFDVSPNVKGDTSTPVLTPVGGTIVETGIDKESGLYHLIQGDDGGAWGLGHHSKFVRREGRVERGDVIAYMGMSGTGAKGVHVHVWRATNMAAARRIVTGYTNLRKGRTIAAWAESMGGLTDPYPHYLAAIADEDRRVADAQEEEDTMNWKDRYLLQLIAESQGRVEARTLGNSDALERLNAAVADLAAELGEQPAS